MEKTNFIILIDKYLDGTATPAERALVEEFYKRLNVKEKSVLSPGQELELENSMLNNIQRAVFQPNKNKGTIRLLEKPRNLKYILSTAAASILLVMFAGYFTYHAFSPRTHHAQNYISKSTKEGERTKVILSDGTVVNLNSGTTIRYEKNFNSKYRKISLDGEAFFEVFHDHKRPFVISSGDVTTTVLGTSFNVAAFPGREVAVTVVTGKVKVESKKNVSKPLYLLPGNQARIDVKSGKIVKNSVDVPYSTSWRSGVIQFKNASESEILDRLSRWYGVRFTVLGSGNKNWGINGSFKEKSLEFILSSLSYTVEFKYKIEGKNIIIQYPNKQ